ncbi:MAG TPA: glutathione S-transferase N-terminal domain-containing protein [Solirubrobacterales bacterium]|nr:glutathione S-transferase N-terminal domain-containing protein [Solirubrobacterales bacterium]
MTVKLYSLATSHPARAAGLMLRHKGVEHEIVNLPPGSQPVVLRVRGFPGPTVPALEIDGRRVQGSREISRALDKLQPEPPLFPSDPERREAVEAAETWGEAVYQSVPRRIFRWSLSHDRDLRVALAEASDMPAIPIVASLTRPVAVGFALAVGATAEAVRGDLATLPTHLDRIDSLIADGVIGGEELNAADFQIGTSTRVLLNFPQIAPLIEGRPAGEHAMRIAPNFGRQMSLRLPPEWLPEGTPARVS